MVWCKIKKEYCKEKQRRACRNIKVLLWRTKPTETHRKVWQNNFETVLNTRA